MHGAEYLIDKLTIDIITTDVINNVATQVRSTINLALEDNTQVVNGYCGPFSGCINTADRQNYNLEGRVFCLVNELSQPGAKVKWQWVYSDGGPGERIAAWATTPLLCPYVGTDEPAILSEADMRSFIKRLFYPSIVAQPTKWPYLLSTDIVNPGGGADPRVDKILAGKLYPWARQYIKGDGTSEEPIVREYPSNVQWQETISNRRFFK